jgi:hypothetical protein
MDRLAAHVIATAALTVTLATVPVLFADASHAASTPAPSSSPATTASSRQAPDARNEGSEALPALPPLAPETEPQAAAAAQAPAAGPASRAAKAGPYGDRGIALRHRGTRSDGQSPCADRIQVGAPGYELYHGMVAFSVREFYSPSCHSFYGYSFAWLQFRRLHVPYDVGMAVYDAGHDTIVGARSYTGGTGGPGYWSAAVPADQASAGKGDCVQGEGHYFYYPAGVPGGFEEGDTLSTKVCAV